MWSGRVNGFVVVATSSTPGFRHMGFCSISVCGKHRGLEGELGFPLKVWGKSEKNFEGKNWLLFRVMYLAGSV